MKGLYTVIDTFTDGTAKAAVGEDVYEVSPEAGEHISHEIVLTVGSSLRLILWAHEIPRVIAVLQQAKALAGKRVDEFERQDEALPTTV